MVKGNVRTENHINGLRHTHTYTHSWPQAENCGGALRYEGCSLTRAKSGTLLTLIYG